MWSSFGLYILHSNSTFLLESIGVSGVCGVCTKTRSPQRLKGKSSMLMCTRPHKSLHFWIVSPEMLQSCSKENVDISAHYSNIFIENIHPRTVKTLMQMTKFRRNIWIRYLKWNLRADMAMVGWLLQDTFSILFIIWHDSKIIILWTFLIFLHRPPLKLLHSFDMAWLHLVYIAQWILWS